VSIRLEVNINEECEAALNAYMEKHDVTRTEAIRAAISLLHYTDNNPDMVVYFIEGEANGR
jgi:hypothetical protein